MTAHDLPHDAPMGAFTPAGQDETDHRAFDVTTPTAAAIPLVCASPHSGRFYPPEMMRAAALDAAAIRRSEDAFVDTLVASAPGFGAALISARYARAYIDVNREPYELDQAMFEDKLPAYANARTARVAAGLGSIAKVVAEGQEIYRGKLMFSDARDRIDRVHQPYHHALEGLIKAARERFGIAILIDWHSMPSAAAGGDARLGAPDMVLGDRFGTSCAPAFTRMVEGALEKHGYRVTRNAPYAGGYTTEFYGRPAQGVHALQVELNRALYFDERTLRPNNGFERLANNLKNLFGTIANCDWRAFA